MLKLKLSSGSNRYFKAQLRPLTKPVFWASATLFGLSIFALVNLFQQPDAVLSSGDPNAVVSLDENESLTPEERARAAEIDDLSVLLKDLDKAKTIESVSGQPNQKIQTANLEIPEAIANLEANKPTNLPTASNNQFQQLPLLDLSPQSQDNRGQIPSNSGFVGFDPRASAQVNGLTASSSTNIITPLAAALERNNDAAATAEERDGSAPPRLTLSNGTALGNQHAGTVITTSTEANGSSDSLPISTSSQVTLSTPTYASPQNLAAQSNNNTYNPALNPNLTAPTLISPISPAQPAQPTASSSINLGSLQTSQPSSINLTPSPSTQPPSPVFGTPSAPSTAIPTANNPVPFSAPNNTPGRFIGNGEINTFANP